jgi:hypothetical protein
MKKIGSLALAGVMAASLSIPAFASENTTEVETTYKPITIAVTVPATGTAVINPYGLPIEYNLGTTGQSSYNVKKVEIKGQQITTTPMAIKNNGKTELNVYATVTSEIPRGSGVEFVYDVADDTYVTEADSKQVQVKLQAVASTLSSYSISDDDIIYDVAKDTSWSGAKSLMLNKDGAAESGKTALATLKAVTATAEENNGKTNYDAGSIAYIRLTGVVAEDPEDPWTESDGFTTTIAFTFKPASST